MGQEIKQEGREEARRELLQQAEEIRQQVEEARRRTIEVMRHTLLGVVQVRFPKLSRLAMGQITLVEDSAALSDLAIKISGAQTVEEAQEHLLTLGQDEEGA